jgi:hypothetical protein
MSGPDYNTSSTTETAVNQYLPPLGSRVTIVSLTLCRTGNFSNTRDRLWQPSRVGDCTCLYQATCIPHPQSCRFGVC